MYPDFISVQDYILSGNRPYGYKPFFTSLAPGFEEAFVKKQIAQSQV